MQENTDQENSEYGHFSRSDYCNNKLAQNLFVKTFCQNSFEFTIFVKQLNFKCLQYFERASAYLIVNVYIKGAKNIAVVF